MKFFKKLLVILVTGSLLFTLSGCWNYREIESLSIVSGIAIDKGSGGYKYKITVQYLELSGGTKCSTKAKLADSQGNTLFDAVRNLINQSQKKYYFSDCKIAVISNELAEEGISPLFDWFNRDSEPRITIDLLISKEDTASSILEPKESSEDITAFSINKMIDNSQQYLGKCPNIAIYQATNMLFGQGISLVLPAIRMKTSGNEKTPELNGCAVFKSDKLVGYLDDYDSQNMLYVQNRFKNGLLLTNVNSIEPNIALEITECKTTVSPHIENDNPSIQIKLCIKAMLAEENSSENNANDLGITEIQNCANKTLESNISDTIKKVQEQYNSDIFGFGALFYQNHPSYWDSVSSEWNQIFRQLDYQIKVDIQIKNTRLQN